MPVPAEKLPDRWQIACSLPECDASEVVATAFALPPSWCRLMFEGLVVLPEQTFCSGEHAERHVVRFVTVMMDRPGGRIEHELLGSMWQDAQKWRAEWAIRHAELVENARIEAEARRRHEIQNLFVGAAPVVDEQTAGSLAEGLWEVDPI